VVTSDEHPPHRPGIGRPNPDPDRQNAIAGRIVLADGTRLMVTTHCVDRFWERAASGCTTFRAALEHLRRLASQTGAFADPPAWAGELAAGRYVALGNDVGLVVVRGELAVTCLARGIIGDAVRELRNRARRRRPRGRSI
jgi:hypothetical protein